MKSSAEKLLPAVHVMTHKNGSNGAVRALSIASEEDDESLDDLEFEDLNANFALPPPPPPTTELRPNPVELPGPINPEGGLKQSVETHRNLFCNHYDNCLDEAVRRSWNSFSCISCGYYRVGRSDGELAKQNTKGLSVVGGTERAASQRRA